MVRNILIVVDMLNDFINEDGALYCGPTASAIVPAVEKIVKEFREREDPLIFLMDAHKEDDIEFKRFPKHCVKDTEGAKIISSLIKNPSRREFYIEKTRYSGFYGTNLETILANIKTIFGMMAKDVIDTVEVVGVCTSICVMDTVGGLANRDYKIRVHKNCVADFDQEMHKMALSRMELLYGAEVVEGK